MSDTEQQTLAGESALEERTRPLTLVYCYKCGDHILRSDRFDHEHRVYVPPWDRSAFEYPQTEVDG
jgi:hypothetical protein